MKSEKAKGAIEEEAKRRSMVVKEDGSIAYNLGKYISFQRGAEWMREELTRWHDASEPPQDLKQKLIKIDDCGYIQFSIGQWCPDSKRWWGAGIDENSKVVGWREIDE